MLLNFNSVPLTFIFLLFDHHEWLMLMPTVGLLGSIAAVHNSIGGRQHFAGFSRTPSMQKHRVTMAVYPKYGRGGELGAQSKFG